MICYYDLDDGDDDFLDVNDIDNNNHDDDDFHTQTHLKWSGDDFHEDNDHDGQ